MQVYKRTLDETINLWLYKAIVSEGHIHYLPDIKNIINKLNQDAVKKVYNAILQIYNIVSDAYCPDDDYCKLCDKRKIFLRSLNKYILFIRKKYRNFL